jgi:hypothetical protein
MKIAQDARECVKKMGIEEAAAQAAPVSDSETG